MSSSSSEDETMEVDDEKLIIAPQNKEINALKILKDIRLICHDPLMAAATYRVYLDLCEVRKYEEVTYQFHDEIKQVYLKAKRKKEDLKDEIIIPLLSMKKYSFEDFGKYQDTFNSESISIAICDSSTIAIYNLTRS